MLHCIKSNNFGRDTVNLVSKSTLASYYECYLYKLLREHHEDNNKFHYVITKYLANTEKGDELKNENIISRDNNNSKKQSNRVGEPKPEFKKQDKQKKDEKVKQKNMNSTFVDLKKSFETAEWLRKSNSLKVDISNNLTKMKIKKIDIINLNNNSENYLPLNSRSLNLLYSVIIGINLDIILIFNDQTIISLAPKNWLETATPETLIKNNYSFVYHDLDIRAFEQDLKSICVDEITAPQYIQMWLKYIPIVFAKDK